MNEKNFVIMTNESHEHSWRHDLMSLMSYMANVFYDG